MKKYVFVILLLVAGLMFVFDPFGWWPMPEIGIPCNPMSLQPRCTGKINLF